MAAVLAEPADWPSEVKAGRYVHRVTNRVSVGIDAVRTARPAHPAQNMPRDLNYIVDSVQAEIR